MRSKEGNSGGYVNLVRSRVICSVQEENKLDETSPDLVGKHLTRNPSLWLMEFFSNVSPEKPLRNYTDLTKML